MKAKLAGYDFQTKAPTAEPSFKFIFACSYDVFIIVKILPVSLNMFSTGVDVAGF